MKKGKANKNVLSQLDRVVKSKYKNTKLHPNAISKHLVDLTENKNPLKNLKSNIETKNLDEFIELAKLANKKYEVLNEQVVIQTMNTNNMTEINQNQFSQIFLNNALKNSAIKLHQTKSLKIPKRPKWNKGIPPKEYERLEREAFLNWRRGIADEEEKNMNYAITPFEKNIEVWRQLWHVVDRCDLLIQIVDGRNPLYFHCPDLESYIKDVNPNKQCLLLVNKADLLHEKVRKSWADYFDENGIKYLFFSALKEGIKITEEIEREFRKENQDEEEENDESEEPEKNQNKFMNFKNLIEEEQVTQNEEQTDLKQENNVSEKLSTTEKESDLRTDMQLTDEVIEDLKKLNTNPEEIVKSEQENPTEVAVEKFNQNIKILNREQVIEILKSYCKKPDVTSTTYIGFVGYPNVGKSSVINVLMKKKRVAVAQMPGKTRHYQTLFLPDGLKDICLMDCPGLVFPSFTSSKAAMVVNGILQIDTLREYHLPISIVIQHIPKKVLEQFYKLELPDIYSATQFLQCLAAKRGFITGRALPDEAKMAKLVLKDYVSGKIIHCVLRPDYNEEVHGKIPTYDYDNEFDEEDKEKFALLKEIPADFDDDFDKINIDVDTNRQLKTHVDNFDKIYFEHMMNQDQNIIDPKTQKITKDMKRALKFSFKRGEITEDEYENAVTFEDYQNILLKIHKNSEVNKKDLVGVKVISLDK
jgi:large subunit GTPase 1